jgi:nitrile hydratase
VNGVHDLGGMDGFGPVEREPDEPVFHQPWERTTFGVASAVFARRLYRTDVFRYAIERMDPAHYLGSSYYEHWLTAVATLLVERGVIDRAELERRAGGCVPLSRPAPPLRLPTPDAAAAGPRFVVGSAVRVGTAHPAGHTRCPRYVRGKLGVVIRHDGPFALPDVKAHADHAADDHAYGVRFEARELWGPDAAPNQTVHVDLWEHWLEPA